MDLIKESARVLPVFHEADVCVVGGSCTGVFAAVRAARLGARVCVIEKQNCFGGMATAGGVNIWHSLHNTAGDRQIIAGLTAEIIERLKKRHAVREFDAAHIAFALNSEELKIELDELVTEYRIKPFLHTFFAAAIMENNAIKAIAVENKDGRGAIRAKQFIDATGDGDLARSAGLSTMEGGALQPPTTCAKLYGLQTLGDFDWQRAISEYGHEFGLKNNWGWGISVPGLPDIKMRADTRLYGVDASNATQLTNAEIEGRRQVRAIMDIIRKYGPPQGAVALADLAASIGIRETPRIATQYVLSGDDVLYGRCFDDAIAYGSYRVDIHDANGSGITFRYLDGREQIVTGRGAATKTGRWRDPLPEDPTFYQIPLRSLLQERVTNLMLAGRMLGADKVAFSAARVMVNLNQTGEAAGVTSTICLSQGCNVQNVDARQVRKLLTEGGSVLCLGREK